MWMATVLAVEEPFREEIWRSVVTYMHLWIVDECILHCLPAQRQRQRSAFTAATCDKTYKVNVNDCNGQ